jgi:hypothetical protein
MRGFWSVSLAFVVAVELLIVGVYVLWPRDVYGFLLGGDPENFLIGSSIGWLGGSAVLLPFVAWAFGDVFGRGSHG